LSFALLIAARNRQSPRAALAEQAHPDRGMGWLERLER